MIGNFFEYAHILEIYVMIYTLGDDDDDEEMRETSW